MSNKHTPGPWAVSKGYDGSLSVSATKSFRINNISAGTPVICDVYPHLDADGFSGEANARLIAAAPELLEALIGLDEAYCRAGEKLTRDERTEDRKRLIAARAAIAKATGGGA